VVERTDLAAGVTACVASLRTDLWVLDEHRPLGQAVLPGTAYLELACAAMQPHSEGRPLELREVYFLAPLALEDHETREVRTILSPRGNGYELVIVSRLPETDEWQEHARGEIALAYGEPPPARDPAQLLGRRDVECIETDGGSRHPFAQRVRAFPPHWRVFERVALGADAGEGLATLRLADGLAGEPAELSLHPALLDMATGFLSMLDGFERGVPFHYRRVRLWRPLQPRILAHARRAGEPRADERSYDVTVLDGDGNTLLEVEGLTLRSFGLGHRGVADGPGAADALDSFGLEIERTGNLATLGLRARPRRQPGPGEVEIEVEAAGLSFIEVLYALGLLPEPPGGGVRFGLECAGTVTTLGAGASDFRVGDRVYGLVAEALGRYAIAAANAIALVPEDLGSVKAATLPAAFLTAFYALIARGRLRAGERVLIHAAAGGVGLAAVNIAQWRGAEVFATAGSPAKREYLAGRGIRHCFDSRSLDFAAQVMDATGGRGVDLVLNSLGGDFIRASLSVLARYGRFLELGKRDILQNAALGLGAFEKHLSFTAIDVGPELPEFDRVWRAVTRLVRQGRFRPLPHREFPLSRASEAFEHMARGRHIGKVVLTVGPEDAAAVGKGQQRGRPLDDGLGRGGASQASAGNASVAAPASRAEVLPPSGGAGTPPAAGHARPALSTAHRAPAGDTERTLVAIWQELLGVAEIGVDDNFFELRGDSLLAAQMTARIHETLRVRLPLSSVFEQPTPAGLAGRIERLAESLRALEVEPESKVSSGEVEHEL
jgi:NADPH:quinone reductase-like Zn-dependent oxidoreductase